MPLLLTERDVSTLLTMPDAIQAVEDAFRAQAGGDGTANQPRSRFFLPSGVLHHMAAALPGKGVMGTKTYTSFGGQTRFYVQLFSTETGELLAFIEADKLGQVRTGAATGVAARYLSRPDVQKVALLGTGWQARTQAEAIFVARPEVREFQVWGRDFARREKFCREMTRRLNIHFQPFDSAEAAVRGTQIVVCATSATSPVLMGDWLSPGDFIAAVGANRLTAREIDEEAVARAEVIVVDDIGQAQTEAAELIFAYEKRKFSWAKAVPLSRVVSGQVPGRPSENAITLFKSLGIALEDIAVAQIVVEKARAQNVGREMWA